MSRSIVLPPFISRALTHSYRPPRQLFWMLMALVHHDSDQCLMWPFGKYTSGYGQIGVFYKCYPVHRLAFRLTRDQHLPDSLIVMHTCDNPPCFNPVHLCAGTNLDNMHDAVAKGRMAKGERVRGSKLKPADIKIIRRFHANGWSQCKIAAMFGVSQTAIWHIIHGDTWHWL